MNEKEKREFYVATCRCCLIDETMKTCRVCHFSIGLAAKETQSVGRRGERQPWDVLPPFQPQAGDTAVFR